MSGSAGEVKLGRTAIKVYGHFLEKRTATASRIKMTDYERTVLEHYQLSTAYPVEWPVEKDTSDASDEEQERKPLRNGMMRRSKSRYSALERVASDRKSFLPGSQKGENGVDTMVQRDEPDPLGSTDSVVRVLRQMGLPVQEDPRISRHMDREREL